MGIATTPTRDTPVTELPADGVRKVRKWGLVVVLGSFLFGYDTGVVSGALLFIKRDFGLGSFEQSSVVSVLLLGAVFGALVAGGVADRIGRRPTLGALGVIFAIGIAIAALANGYVMLMSGRVVMGVGVGGVSSIVPTFLSEITPAQIRGRMLSLNQLQIPACLLVAYVVNLGFSSSEDWRAIVWVGAIPAVLLALGCLWLPESPAWQIANGRADAARQMITSVTSDARADVMIEAFQAREAVRKCAQAHVPGSGRLTAGLLSAPGVRPALVVGLVLAAIQQFAGINTIIYYAPTIMQETGLSAGNSIFYSLFIGIINLGITIVSLRLIDRVGRRPLLLVSLGGMLVFLVLVGLSFVAGLARS